MDGLDPTSPGQTPARRGSKVKSVIGHCVIGDGRDDVCISRSSSRRCSSPHYDSKLFNITKSLFQPIAVLDWWSCFLTPKPSSLVFFGERRALCLLPFSRSLWLYSVSQSVSH